MSPYCTGQNHKLYEFVAHGSAVTCLALGQKSGRVMVTGGDDAKINLWAIGKPNCIMSLNGHRTSIECAKFNQNEDIVGAGSASGAIKLWDLEAAKLIQTLTGHKTNVRCLDFHPYGHFLASGSFDTSIKLWDYRKKSCIITYKVHSKDVHCLKLSPDGRWLASGGNEGSVMLYDIVAGKMLAELKGHSSSVTDVVFHPNEFLLASSSTDGTVKFWDLESFIQVSTTTYQHDMGPIRKIAFHTEGKTLITSGKDLMKIYGWEPTHLYDVAQTNWGRLNDMAVLDEQIVAGTYSTTNVAVYMVDLTLLQPFCFSSTNKSHICSRNNVLRQSTRRSFNFDQTSKTCKQLESLDSNRTDDFDTNGSMDGVDSMAEIYNACDYREIFQSRRELTRTPPPLDNPNSSNDQNLRILQQQAAIDASLSSPNGGYSSVKPTMKSNLLGIKNAAHSTSLHSVRQISDSLNNLNLNQLNNNLLPSSPLSPIAGVLNNNEHLIKQKANNNGAPVATTLPHSTSLTGLNQFRTTSNVLDDVRQHSSTTFPLIANNSNRITPSIVASPYTPTSTTAPLLSPLNQISSPAVQTANANSTTTMAKVSEKQSNNNITANLLPTTATLTPNRITSVVRPVVNDTNNRSSITAYPVLPQQQHKNTDSQTSKKSSSSIVQVSPSMMANNTANNFGNNDGSHIINSHNTSITSHHHQNNNSGSNSNDNTSLIIPEIRDHPAGLDFNDFLPKHIQQYGCDQQPFISETETINTIMKGHKAAKAGLDYRRKQVQIVLAMWATKDSKTALEYAINLDEKSIIIDILNVMIWKPSSWNLDIALILLPCIQELLQSKYESYMSVGCSALSLILKTFSSTIKNNISAPPGIGVDISREERYNKCMKCYKYLLEARAFVLKRQTLQGKIGRSFRELSILMQNLD